VSPRLLICRYNAATPTDGPNSFTDREIFGPEADCSAARGTRPAAIAVVSGP